MNGEVVFISKKVDTKTVREGKKEWVKEKERDQEIN